MPEGSAGCSLIFWSMKTAHQLARELLFLPDYPVWIYEKGYTPIGNEPNAQAAEGYTEDGDVCNVIEIYSDFPMLGGTMNPLGLGAKDDAPNTH